MSSLVKRHVEHLARELMAYSPGLIIEGARQVGKSTLAGQLVDGSDALIVTLDDQQVRSAAAEDMPGFLAQAGRRTMVIDEIQRLPELTLAVKSSIDSDRTAGRFILTGSASLLRARGLADSLAGRVLRLQLYGLSQGELHPRNDDFAARLTADTDRLPEYRTTTTRADYAALIGRGAYPEVQDLPETARRRWLDSYLDRIVRRDLADLRREINPARTESLLRALAGNQSGELVKARLAAATSIPASTVTSYLDLLHDVGLFTTIPPWTPNLAKREVGRQKSLIVDSALATRLARVTTDQLQRLDHGEAFGGLLEGFVGAELLRQQTWTAQEFQLFHYRDRDGLEVDFVLELTGGQVIAIEVKGSTSFNRNQFHRLREIRERFGDRFIAGIVLNTGTTGYRYGDRLYGLPVDALWSL
ncbi:ATP-binding protein [Nakamurella lactea]|uniref:ATP-binding protein n=1 Tax=Nakamurella lactea TaxID=459515 RepID=UPI000405C8CC|nr:ATP-binding protein [Nakamurella lactea]